MFHISHRLKELLLLRLFLCLYFVQFEVTYKTLQMLVALCAFFNLSALSFFNVFCYIAYIWQSWCIFQWCDYWPTSGCELSDVPASWNCSIWHFCCSLLWATAWHRGQGCSVAPAAAAGKHCAECSAAAAQDISCQPRPIRQRRWWWHCWRWAQPLVRCSVWTSQAGTTTKSVFLSWFSVTVCMQHLLGLKHLFVYNTALLTQFFENAVFLCTILISGTSNMLLLSRTVDHAHSFCWLISHPT